MLTRLSLLALGLLASTIAVACKEKATPARVDYSSLQALAAEVRTSAGDMHAHAGEMGAIGRSAGDAHWAAHAEAMDADARSVEALATTLETVASSLALNPPGKESLDLKKLLGDGLTLRALGASLAERGRANIEHANAMRADPSAAQMPELERGTVLLEQDGRLMVQRGDQIAAAGERLETNARDMARAYGVSLP